MKKNNKKIFILFILFILIVSCFFILFNETEENNEIIVKHAMDDYPYSLDERDTLLFENEYDSLVEILTKDEVDYDLYAKQISKLFIIDLYTLNNKISKYDVGGSDYMYESISGNFKLKVEDTLYKYVSTIDDENLPEVNSIEIISFEQMEITYNDTIYDGYKLELSWEYNKDLSYDNYGEITIIKDNDKILKIVEFLGEYK